MSSNPLEIEQVEPLSFLLKPAIHRENVKLMEEEKLVYRSLGWWERFRLRRYVRQLSKRLNGYNALITERDKLAQICIRLKELVDASPDDARGPLMKRGQAAMFRGRAVVWRIEIIVELPSGGSFAVAGLMQHNTKQVINGFPGVKDLPVLGALFRSRDFQNDESELVVLISAYLVEPNAVSAFSAPTDGFVAPTDPETLLLGRLNAVYKRKEKPLAAQATAPVGFIVR